MNCPPFSPENGIDASEPYDGTFVPQLDVV